MVYIVFVMAKLNNSGQKTPQHLWKETVYVESLMFTLSIFQSVSLLTTSNLVKWTPLVVEVHFLVLLHLEGVSSVVF